MKFARLGKLEIFFIGITVLWISIPLWTKFNTGDVAYDLGSQLYNSWKIWALYGVIKFISNRINKRRLEKQKFQ